jgi:hypothetical protein
LKVYTGYLLSLSAAFSVINIVLAFFGQDAPAIYFIINTIAFFVISLAFNLYFRSPPALQALSGVILAGFLFFLALKILTFI